MNTSLRASSSRIAKAVLACSVALLAASPLSAQTTYTVVDLSAPGSYDTANAASGGQAAGFTAATATLSPTRAALWTGTGLTDLHPAHLLDNATAGITGRSTVTGFAGNLQVGWGIGANTTGSVAIAWRDTAASATFLPVPFSNFGSQALGTDGKQIVGYAGMNNADGTGGLAFHAMLWDANTGAAIDLGGGSKGAQAVGVGGGQQVGYVVKTGTNAALWKGTSKSLVSLHPKNAVVSRAAATDGVRQVGSATYSVRIRQEAAKGNHDANYSYATVWTGTAASALNIHPYPFQQSYATGVSGAYIVGVATDPTKTGTPAYNHAIVWDATYQATDLNAFLPAGFTGATATGVDAEGNVAGMMLAPDGRRHAIVWVPNP